MSQLPSPSELISASWENFARNFRTYADYAIWYTLLAVIQWGLFVTCKTLFADEISRNAVLLFATLPVAIAGMAVTASLIDATAQGVQGRSIDERASFVHGLHKLIPFIWVSILTLVTYLFGLALFVIPLFIFAVWFCFAQYFTVVDDQHGAAAMGASRRAVKGRFFAVAIRLLFPAVFFFVAATFARNVLFLIVGSLFGDPGAFFGRVDSLDDLSNLQTLLTSVLPVTVNALLFLPLIHGSNLLLWSELKRTSR